MRRVKLFILFVILTGCSARELPVLSAVPDFKLTERSSREVRRDELAGKVWVADFIFTQCGGTCPVMTSKMKTLQDTLPPEIQLVSFSVDPEHDTPEVLKEYADRNGADPKRWLFLTGDKSDLYKLSIDGFKLALDANGGAPAEPIVHSTRFALVDRQGRIRGYYGMEDETAMEQLSKDIKTLL